MKKRTLPYGYEFRDGKICASEREAQTVRELFSRYTDGASFLELALRVQSEGVPYSEGEAKWDKNKVARIINNDVYLGTDTYPALIGQSLYEQAAARKPAYGKSERTAEAKAIREISRCGCCGGKIHISSGRNGWTRWNCSDHGELGANATTEKIVKQVTEIIQSMIRGDCAITEPPPKGSEQSALASAQDEFNALLEAECFDETAAMTKAMNLAAVRYENIGAADFETMRIRYLVERAETTDGLDIDLLRKIATEIRILPSGETDVVLKNGQIIGRNDTT